MVDMKKGDTLPALVVTITKTDGTALDLTDSTAKFVMVDSAGVEIIDEAMTVTDAENGIVQYEWQAGDTDTAGEFRGEVKVTYSDGTLITAPAVDYIPINIDEDLDVAA